VWLGGKGEKKKTESHKISVQRSSPDLKEKTRGTTSANGYRGGKSGPPKKKKGKIGGPSGICKGIRKKRGRTKNATSPPGWGLQ